MKHKTKSIAKILLMLSGTGAAILASWQLPRFVFAVYDRNTLQKKEEVQMELYAFEKERTWDERLYSLALRSSDPLRYSISSVMMKTENDMLTGEELTNIVNEELKSFSECDIRFSYPVIQAQDLVSRELYMAYITDNEKKASEGSIAFWKLTYEGQSQDGWYHLELALDMEYHKLYAIRLSDELVTDIKEIQNKHRYYHYQEESAVLMEALTAYYQLPEKAKYQIVTVLDDYDSYAGSVSATDAEKDDKICEVEMAEDLEEKDDSRSVLWYTRGSILFETKENIKSENDSAVRLPFIREYGIENEKGYVYIGVKGLYEILQI